MVQLPGPDTNNIYGKIMVMVAQYGEYAKNIV